MRTNICFYSKNYHKPVPGLVRKIPVPVQNLQKTGSRIFQNNKNINIQNQQKPRTSKVLFK
jgi:hypothetical protein